jgi:all-trans-retinol dehydrogenase (NAD+)
VYYTFFVKTVKDKLVLITGAASGIGRLMALDFAGRGARVAVWDLNGEALKALEEEARGRGFFIKTMVCDISGRNTVYRQAETLMGDLGPVDILINNAGVVSGSTLLETPDEKIIQTINVNVLAAFWVCKAFLPVMLKRNTGHIVNISLLNSIYVCPWPAGIPHHLPLFLCDIIYIYIYIYIYSLEWLNSP